MHSFPEIANVSFFALVSSCGVISKLKNLENGATENKYSILIDCLCRWGKVEHVLELIYEWISPEPNVREVSFTNLTSQLFGLCSSCSCLFYLTSIYLTGISSCT